MPTEQHRKTFQISYSFVFDDQVEKEFVITIDEKTLHLQLPEESQKPFWTKLNYECCENCPLDSSIEYCPVALNIASLIDSFKDYISYKQTKVIVKTLERIYSKETTLQKGLSAIIGILMVTNECPIMSKLSPLVRFHLPFATHIENIYRVVSMYLLAQYYRGQKGLTPDWDLSELSDFYKSVSRVNRGISRRISVASNKDANINAIVILHSLGETLPFAIESNLSELEFVFTKYFGEEAKKKP